MPNKEINKSNGLRSLFYKGALVRFVVQAILGVALLAGGIIMLALKLPGWSIIFGIPMVVISSVFIIYTYDDALSRRFEHSDNEEEKSKSDNINSGEE